MTTLVIACIVFLVIVSLYFINDSRKAHGMWKLWQDACFGVEIQNTRLKEELRTWKRPRKKNGRFT
jgi:hypothetical protein